MLSKKKPLHVSRPGKCLLPIIAICTCAWLAPSDTFAQQAAPATLEMAAPSSLRLLDRRDPAALSPSAKAESAPVVLSRLYAPTSSIDGRRHFHTVGAMKGKAANDLPNQTGANLYSLLHDQPALGSFLFDDQMKRVAATTAPVTRDFYVKQMGHPLPLLQLNMGDWQLPVVLSSAPRIE